MRPTRYGIRLEIDEDDDEDDKNSSAVERQ